MTTVSTHSNPQRSSPEPPTPLGEHVASLWRLDPAITFLNHGSFGARPAAVQEHQDALRHEFERSPVVNFDRNRTEMINRAKEPVARFVGTSPEDIGFVTNTTEGINGILRSIEFKPGDELLTTDHVYNAIRQTMRFTARRAGATYTEMEIPLPISGLDEVSELIRAALSDRTRLVVIDHITSPTAAVLPIKPIIDACQDRGIDVIVDGAHGPGMLPLDLESLGCAYYVGNLHKWVCAPPGAAFLWARKDKQQDLHPAVISHFLDEGMSAEFDWQGTRDFTPWLTAAYAIEWFEQQFGWDHVRQHNHDLACWVHAMLADRWGTELATPIDGSMLGSMACIALPERFKSLVDEAWRVPGFLYDRCQIECPVNECQGRWWIRPSCQVYNTPDQYERFADAVMGVGGLVR